MEEANEISIQVPDAVKERAAISKKRKSDECDGQSVTRAMVRVFTAIAELPYGRYWLHSYWLDHGTPCDEPSGIRYWRKSIITVLGFRTANWEDPIKQFTRIFPAIYECFLAEFNPKAMGYLTMEDMSSNIIDGKVQLAAMECGLSHGLLQTAGCELEAKWGGVTRRDFEWCVRANKLRDYEGKFEPSKRKMCFDGSCHCWIAEYCERLNIDSDLVEKLFLRYKTTSSECCSIFAKDTARLLEISHEASYVKGSHRSKAILTEDNAIKEDMLVDCPRIHAQYSYACRDIANGDGLLGDGVFVLDYFLRGKRNCDSLIVLMIGDVDECHSISDSSAGFEVRPKLWMNADMSSTIAMLHVDLREGVYPARVYTRTGASNEAKKWIESSFLESEIFQSFCRRWELKPCVV